MKKHEVDRIVKQIRRKSIDAELVQRIYLLMGVLYIMETKHGESKKLFFGYDFESNRERLLYEISSKIIAYGYFPMWLNRSMNSHFPLESRYDEVMSYISNPEFDIKNITSNDVEFVEKILR